MTTVFYDFKKDTDAYINPGDFTKEISGFPEICITTFSEKIINQFVEKNSPEIIACLYSANGSLPVYAIEFEGLTIGFFLSRVGAPACVAGLEEVIAMGAKKIVVFGSCGVLNQSVVGNKIILPSCAVRDEGTSYHYIPEVEEINADRSAVRMAAQCLDKNGIPYVIGKVWTTDAIYRETKRLIEERKKQGCIAVDMECSACLALAEFRRIPVIPFLFGADNLDSAFWEPRDLTDYGLKFSNQYLRIALQICVELNEERLFYKK